MSKVLIVDDEKEVSEAMGVALRIFGYEVFTAFNGETAVEITKKEKPDIILLDIYFPKPGMDGIETLKMIREFNKEVKVILTTGMGTEAKQLDNAQNLGISKFLSKPLSIAQLKETIEEILG